MTQAKPAAPAIPLVDLTRQTRALRPELDRAIASVIDSTAFIQGPDVKAFEGEFASFVGTSGCVGTASGTASLFLALRACGVTAGTQVVTTAHTFAATAEAICLLGAIPRFVDIDPATYQMDPGATRKAIGPKTKAILPVHLYGHPADMDPLLELGAAKGIPIVEDAAQAHGATYNGRPVGSMGALSCFSFYPGKNLGAFGDAGSVNGNDKTLLESVRSLRDHGRTSKYEHKDIGYGERLDTLQAAILRVKLRHLPAWNTARRAIAKRYFAELAGLPVRLPTPAQGADPCYHLFVIQTKDAKDRDGLLESLKAQGIGAGVHYPIPLHKQPAFRDLPGVPSSLPHAEHAAATIVSLPLFPEMTDHEVGRVVQAVRGHYK